MHLDGVDMSGLRLPVRGSSGVDWNAKTPCQWNFGSHVMFNSNTGEIPKFMRSSEWRIENGSIYSSGGGVCYGSDVGNGCSSKGSLSASIDSAPTAGPRSSMINFETASKYTEKNEVSLFKETRITTDLIGAPGPVDPPLCLKLGKRTYFEDYYMENKVENLPFPQVHEPSSTSAKRTRASSQGSQKTCCQVEGCNLDLMTAKGYHRKHRVCESHSKSAVVIVMGQERRFCQQCSRFHCLSEFDQRKRSCRRRLYKHNARRRKLPLTVMSHDSRRVSPSLYGDGQQMNLSVNIPPYGCMKPENSTLDCSFNFSLMQPMGMCVKSSKAGSIGDQFCLPSSGLSMPSSTLYHDLERLLPFKSSAAEVLNQGSEAFVVASNLDGTPNFRRALSLLSTDSWCSAHPRSIPVNQLMPENHAASSQDALQVVHSNSNYWLG